MACGAEITACMGFCKAGDMLNEHGELDFDPRKVRELCGKCVQIHRWTPEGTLERLSPDEILKMLNE